MDITYETINEMIQNIDWKEVRAYLKKYVGDFYKVAFTGDMIYIGDDLPSE